ncbi:hypothetical protein BGZ63DRAFT_396772 [Mariannaea sp. PMI_226]|nr:hypothetical protein BGZ63DRAFT_396772 [Mariannaea sp. PMI_226]
MATRLPEPAQRDNNMSHGISSLGVCILEVLAWKRLVQCNQRGTVNSPWLKGKVVSLLRRNRIER